MNHNPDTGAQYVEELDPAITSIVDNNADGNTYFGDAVPGTATSAAAWRIQRMTTSNGANTFKYANGSIAFCNVWDNRTGLTYP